MSEETKSIKINPTYNKVVKNYNKSFTMYAETDLDQPTDYSLRYAEDDSDSSDTDECNKIRKNTTTTTTTITTTTTTTTVTATTTTTSTKNEFVQDTIKTYCTEDTPYETPFNFSTATSLTDLRIDDKPIDKLDNNDATTHNKVVLNDGKIVKSEFSSGLMSPEKPINYCEEGTPGYFSRVPSFSSLNSVTVNENESTTTKTDGKIETKIKETKRNSEVKAVKFEKVVNYAEETPLMFSRSSSFSSLDSIEQHSIHDDKSSVISDFSRLTSGLVSPSELPDSPTQTIPPSPKSRQSKQHKHKTVADNVVELSSPKGNIFEDSVKKFKLESTPIQFSRATSLSSLTIDEHDGNDRQQQQEQNQQESIVEEEQQEQHTQQKEEVVKIEEQQDEIQENSTNDHIEEKLDDNNDNSESEEEDEDMLAACINIGIQNNRYSQQKSNCSSPDLPAFKYPKNQLNDLNQRWVVEEEKKNVPLNSVVDTKIDLNISLETNLGNSTQSLSSISDDDDDDTSSESGGAALLEECILAGMPKKSNIPPNNSLSIKSNELTEAEQQLLEQCILDGMKKSRLSPKKQFTSQQKHHQLTNDLTESERSLLQQCIMAGMQKNNNNNNQHHHHRHHQRPSTSKDNPPELTYTERRLLEQCILDGMPKTNRSINNSNNNNRPINSRRIREYERLNQQSPTTTTATEHTCCIHCPRNQQKQLMLRQNNNHLRMKKKLRNHEQRTQQIHLRENKDINILYVTSQILALKKEMIDRSHEEWV